MMVTKVISGGQIGADIAGLRAAKALGLETSGWMPFGFKTLDGNKPEYADMYGLKETTEHPYPYRTRYNVRDSDGTIRFAENFNTRGELCTLREIHKADKPYFDVPLFTDDDGKYFTTKYHGEIRQWIDHFDIKVLNTAGNARYEIEAFVEDYIKEILK